MRVHASLFLPVVFLWSTVLLLFPPAMVAACRVTIDGEDRTSEFLVAASDEEDDARVFVDCSGPSRCRGAVVSDCPFVRCFDREACNSARIVNFTGSVLCEGLHACHRTEITAAAPSGDETKKREVSCIGSGSCDVARISGDALGRVTCSGQQACRKAEISGPDLVECSGGGDTERSFACTGSVAIGTGCLYCGRRGCGGHTNTCRYYETTDRYEKCEPETLNGKSCPGELLERLDLELSGTEGIDIGGDGGTRRLRAERATGSNH